jgi:DNA-binding transcriptional regulator YiaG
MIHAYNELYLDDAMCIMGEMLDYAVNDCNYDPDVFFGWFISSGIAEQFENGNPKYVSDMSGVELAREVFLQTKGQKLLTPASYPDDRSNVYWAGWIMAYFQWYTSIRFSDMALNGLSVSEVMSLYILHEASKTKFVDHALEIMRKSKNKKTSNLKKMREARGMSQQELSLASGVELRIIQLYEQKHCDIDKAAVITVIRLSKALHCNIEDILESV